MTGDRETLNALECVGPDLADEAEHFEVCVTCGQAFDCRRLGDVLHHDSEMHEPLPVN
jgi:hypothetical protein